MPVQKVGPRFPIGAPFLVDKNKRDDPGFAGLHQCEAFKSLIHSTEPAREKGNRVRLEIVNGDSVITDVLWTHYYVPSKIGADTIYHSAEHPSALTLPVMEGA